MSQRETMPQRDENNNNNNNSIRRDCGSFQEFLDGWLVRQEHYLDELISSQTNSEADLKGLIERVIGHYQQYYEAKSRAAHDDVFMVFSPTWFSALECSFLWIAGFKPALAFRILVSAVEDLSQEQFESIERLKAETKTKTEETQLESEMAMVQESVAAPPLLEMARRMGRLVDGERNQVDAVIGSLRYSMEVLMERADILRASTTRKVIDILNPVQGVKLLAAAVELQLRLRNWGVRRDTQSNP